MTENEAKDWLRTISATQSESIHRSSLGLRKEALYMAIQALEEIQQYREIGTVEEFKALKEVVAHLLGRHLHQTIELYSREECVNDLEPILTIFGISSEVLDRYRY